MRNSLKIKLLLMWLASTFLVLVLAGLTFNSMFSSIFTKDAANRIRTASESFASEIESLKLGLSNNTSVLISKSDVVDNLHIISKYEDKDNYESAVYDPIKEKLSEQISVFAEVSGIDILVLFDLEHQPIAFFRSTGTGRSAKGYVSYEEGSGSVRSASINSSSFMKDARCVNFLHKVQLEGKYLNESFMTRPFGDSVYLEYYAPVIRRMLNKAPERVGSVVAGKYVNKKLLDTIASKIRMDIAVYNDDFYIQTFKSDLKPVVEKLSDDFIKNEGDIEKLNSKINHGSYFLGYMSHKLSPKDTINVVFGLEKDILASKAAIYGKVIILSLIVIAIIVLPFFIFLLNTLVTKPMRRLVSITENLKDGDFVKINMNRSDEFGVLADNFDEMVDSLEKREADLRDSIKELDEYNKVVSAASIVSKSDLKGNITYVNDELCRATGYSRDELLGKPHNIFRHPSTPKKLFKDMWDTIQAKKVWQGLVKNKKKDGSAYYTDVTIVPVLDSDDNIKEYIGLRYDVTKLIESQEELKRIFQTDSLTSLGNRLKLIEDIEVSENKMLALINIDSFKEINDFYGYKAGDEVIKRFGSELFDIASESGINVYRMHADEFALFSNNVNHEKEFPEIIENIVQRIEQNPIEISGNNVKLKASAGICIGSENVLINADLSLKTAKKKQKAMVVYDDKLKTSEEYKNNLYWAAKVREAIEDDRIIPFYQPIFNNAEEKTQKYEALIRLIDDEGKVISPFYFLNIAKKTRDYTKLTRIMVDKVFADFENIDCEFSINLSVEDIIDSALVDYIFGKIDKYRKPERVVFEIVESEGIESFSEVEAFINGCKKHNCKIAIDDFGTGYSNFEYLMKLEVDYIKIDGSLVKNICSSKSSLAVVETIVIFAKKNGLKVIAEFVSGADIYNAVRGLGIEFSQGYFISEPKRFSELMSGETSE